MSLMHQWFRTTGFPCDPMVLGKEGEQIMQEELRAAHKDTYGKRALMHELVNHFFFQECNTEEEVVLCNMAKRKLAQMGIWLPGNEERIVEALLQIPRPLQGDSDD